MVRPQLPIGLIITHPLTRVEMAIKVQVLALRELAQAREHMTGLISLLGPTQVRSFCAGFDSDNKHANARQVEASALHPKCRVFTGTAHPQE